MKTWTVRSVVLGLLAIVAGCILATRTPVVIVYAQTVPAVVRAQWTPNVAADGVTAYQVSLDGGAPVSVAPTVDTTCSCVTTNVSIATFGSHTVAVTATNLLLSSDPASGQQSSAPTTVTFSLNRSPASVTGATVKK